MAIAGNKSPQALTNLDSKLTFLNAAAKKAFAIIEGNEGRYPPCLEINNVKCILYERREKI